MPLPDDWNSYYRFCGQCQRPWHPSGTEDCACWVCAQCGKLTPPVEDFATYDPALCKECWAERGKTEPH